MDLWTQTHDLSWMSHASISPKTEPDMQIIYVEGDPGSRSEGIEAEWQGGEGISLVCFEVNGISVLPKRFRMPLELATSTNPATGSGLSPGALTSLHSQAFAFWPRGLSKLQRRPWGSKWKEAWYTWGGHSLTAWVHGLTSAATSLLASFQCPTLISNNGTCTLTTSSC